MYTRDREKERRRETEKEHVWSNSHFGIHKYRKVVMFFWGGILNNCQFIIYGRYLKDTEKRIYFEMTYSGHLILGNGFFLLS